MRTYTKLDERRDAAMPRGFAPEDEMPGEIRRTERLRSRGPRYRLAETVVAEGGTADVAALLIAVPHDEPKPDATDQPPQCATRGDSRATRGDSRATRAATRPGSPWWPTSHSSHCISRIMSKP